MTSPRPDTDVELGAALLAARDAAGMRQLDVTAATGLPQTRLSRIERGVAIPTEQDVRLLVQLYKVPSAMADALVRTAVEAKAAVRDQRLVVQRRRTAAMQRRWRELEAGASVVRSYQPALVLGVLQTPRYAAIAMGVAPDDPVVEDRLRRHRLLLAEPRRRYVLVQTEGALRATVGSSEVMAEQLDAMVDASTEANVRLGIIPAATPTDLTCGTAFHVYDDTAVVVGLAVATAQLTDRADVDHFDALHDRLAAFAVYDDDARDLLRTIRRSALVRG